MKDRNGTSKSKKANYISRKGIFQYLWLHGELTSKHYKFLWNKYSVLQEIEKCIREFREIFQTKRMPLLYLFIERYKNSSIKEPAFLQTDWKRIFQLLKMQSPAT